MPNPHSICVFCASSSGNHTAYAEEAAHLGTLIAARSWALVYGGASVGLMGTVADAAIAGGAHVLGVLPEVLKNREVAHSGLTELHYVGSMHERKAMMAERADAFVALPGGFGTLDEFLEVLTWAQLGIHAKPCVLVNLRGYFEGLLSFLDHGVREGFLQARHRERILVVSSVAEAIAVLAGRLT